MSSRAMSALQEGRNKYRQAMGLAPEEVKVATQLRHASRGVQAETASQPGSTNVNSSHLSSSLVMVDDAGVPTAAVDLRCAASLELSPLVAGQRSASPSSSSASAVAQDARNGALSDSNTNSAPPKARSTAAEALNTRQHTGESSSSALERWREDDDAEQEDWENMVMKDVRMLVGKQNVASSRSEVLRPLQLAAAPENDVGRGDRVMVEVSQVEGLPVATSLSAPSGPDGSTEVEKRERGMGGAKGASGPTLIRPEDIDVHSGTFASKAAAFLGLSRGDARATHPAASVSLSAVEARRFDDDDDDEDLSLDVKKEGLHSRIAREGSNSPLPSPLVFSAEALENEGGDLDDPFAHGFEDVDFDDTATVASDVVSTAGQGTRAQRQVLMEAEMLRLCERLDPDGEEEEQCEICGNLEQILRQEGALKHALILHHQVITLLEMLDSKSPPVIYKALRVVHEAITERQRQPGRHTSADYTGVIGIIGPLVDNMLTVGLAHRLLATCSLPLHDDDGMLLPVVQQAALVLNSLCWAGEARHVQMLVACQAIPVLVGLLSAQPPLNHVALDCIWKVMNLPPPTPKTDFCHLLARCGATKPLVLLLQRSFDESRQRSQSLGGMDSAVAGWVDLSEQYAERVASILLVFSQANKLVKADMSRRQALEGMLYVLETGNRALSRILSNAFVKLLKTLRYLSGDTAAMQPLQEAGAVGKLVQLLALKQGGAGGDHELSQHGKGRFLASEVHSQAMLALYNLCKLSKVRQEQAAAHGIVPCLQRTIFSKSNQAHPLRQVLGPFPSLSCAIPGAILYSLLVSRDAAHAVG